MKIIKTIPELIEERKTIIKTYPEDFGSFLVGLFVGTFLIAPFIWTPLGRAVVKTAIAKGAKVPISKVEEWIKEGEKS
ncbi:MAG: hypothetical protein QW272_09730 [Candidatus Methanomethylicaceae archaeon]